MLKEKQSYSKTDLKYENQEELLTDHTSSLGLDCATTPSVHSHLPTNFHILKGFQTQNTGLLSAKTCLLLLFVLFSQSFPQ